MQVVMAKIQPQNRMNAPSVTRAVPCAEDAKTCVRSVSEKEALLRAMNIMKLTVYPSVWPVELQVEAQPTDTYTVSCLQTHTP